MRIISKLMRKIKRTLGSVRKINITSFECVTLRLSGMRISTEYELTGGVNPTLSRYFIRYTGKDERELDVSVPCTSEEMTALLNTCHVGSWDGFHGNHPRGVSDGVMFNFTATVNGGETIKAHGSENFPDGYRELVRALDGLLEGSR